MGDDDDLIMGTRAGKRVGGTRTLPGGKVSIRQWLIDPAYASAVFHVHLLPR
jgi:hypothetical protein